MNVSRPSQAIRIARALLLATLPLGAGCGGDDIVWTDPLSLSGSGADGRLVVDGKGRARLVADTSVSVMPTADAFACPGSVRNARMEDGTLAAVWWSVRADSSAVLTAALSTDGGRTWQRPVHVDTADVSTRGCDRPSPSIAASAGFVHIAYSMRGPEGAGVFYAHSMNSGQSYEPSVIILYGDRLTPTSIAADKGTVAVGYEEPSGSSPQIGLAISRDWGHIFPDRVRGSTGVGAATDPEVAVAGREIAVSWAVVGQSGNASEGRTTRIVRVGRLT